MKRLAFNWILLGSTAIYVSFIHPDYWAGFLAGTVATAAGLDIIRFVFDRQHRRLRGER